ncbi:MAG: PilZ domain-containing protein [Planctomycetota bacterium]
MTDPQPVGKRTVDTRKEPRFKTGQGEKKLHCETTLSACGIRRGTVVDISRTGIRLLCEGNFEVGQPIFTELTTDRSHGIYQ